jgi:hypothetical protein
MVLSFDDSSDISSVGSVAAMRESLREEKGYQRIEEGETAR